MTFAELTLELMARMDSLSALRAKRFINDAYHEICEEYSWPFLIATQSGAAPLALTLYPQKVLDVVDTTNDRKLAHVGLSTVTDYDPELSQTGAPGAYYIVEQTIHTHPTSTATLSVRHVTVPADLSADGDLPDMPTRYHGLIVDVAQLRAIRRHADSAAMLPVLQPAVERELGKMRDTLMVPSVEGLEIVSTDVAYEVW